MSHSISISIDKPFDEVIADVTAREGASNVSAGW